jgi:hypothetical protein
MSSTSRSVVSGVQYHVLGGVAADGVDRPPRSLDDFVGEARFTIDGEGGAYAVAGTGVQADGAVRFYEKAADPGGRDVRVWLVRPDGVGFVVEHVAAF